MNLMSCDELMNLQELGRDLYHRNVLFIIPVTVQRSGRDLTLELPVTTGIQDQETDPRIIIH